VNSWFSFSAARLAAVALRQQREGSYSARFSCTKIASFIFGACLVFFCFVCVMASAVTSLERAGNPSGWNAATQGQWAFAGAIYWAIITVSTIGYGDIVPLTLLGRFATNAFVVLALVLLAFISTRLLALLEREGAGGGSYAPPSNKASVLVVAPRGAPAPHLLAVFEGLLASQRARFVHVVVLHPESLPTGAALRDLGPLRKGVTLLQGSVFSGRDLARAGAARCEAALVLQAPAADDGENLLALFALRAAFPRMPLLGCVSSHASQHFALTAVAKESLLVLDAVRLGLLAQNALCPGVLPLVLAWLPGTPTAGAGGSRLRLSPPPPQQQQQPQPPPEAPRRPPPPPALPPRPTPRALAQFVLDSIRAAAAPPPPPLPTTPPVPPSRLLELRVPPWGVGRTFNDVAALCFLADAVADAAEAGGGGTSLGAVAAGAAAALLGGSGCDGPLLLAFSVDGRVTCEGGAIARAGTTLLLSAQTAAGVAGEDVALLFRQLGAPGGAAQRHGSGGSHSRSGSGSSLRRRRRRGASGGGGGGGGGGSSSRSSSSSSRRSSSGGGGGSGATARTIAAVSAAEEAEIAEEAAASASALPFPPPPPPPRNISGHTLLFFPFVSSAQPLAPPRQAKTPRAKTP
jgi:hypothetical protein